MVVVEDLPVVGNEVDPLVEGYVEDSFIVVVEDVEYLFIVFVEDLSVDGNVEESVMVVVEDPKGNV